MADSLKEIMASLRSQANAKDKLAKAKAKPQTVLHVNAEAKPVAGFEDMMAQALPKPTAWEESIGESLRRSSPSSYKQGMPKVERLSEVKANAQPKALSLEKQALHNALAKGRAGQRLTKAERKVIGKHGLAVILAQLKSKSKGEGQC